jgi:hypothetical protein
MRNLLAGRLLKKVVGLLLLLLSVCACTPVMAAELSFSWLPSDEESMAGYKIHYGPSERVYNYSIDVGKAEIIDGRVVAKVKIPSGKKFFAATVYDTEGVESDYSNEVFAIARPGLLVDFAKKR